MIQLHDPRLKAAAKGLVLLVVLAFIARHVVLHWDVVREVEPPHWPWVGVATLLALASLTVTPWSLRVLLRTRGIHLSHGMALGLIHVPALGKYVPGKIWSVLGAIYLYEAQGISRRVAVSVNLLLMTQGVIAATLIALVFGAIGEASPLPPWPAGLAIAALLIGTSPRVFYPLTAAVLRRLGRPEFEADLTAGALRVIAILGISYCMYGLAFACLVRAFSDTPWSATPQLVGLFCLAQVAGFLALFAPAGIGVREGVLLVGLGPFVGSGLAIAIAGACRLWQTAAELLVAAIGWQWIRSREPGSS